MIEFTSKPHLAFTISATFPISIDEVTTEWLNKKLGANKNTIATFSYAQIGEAQGASAGVYRVHLKWNDDQRTPLPLVFKFASANSEHHKYAKNMGTYRKEVRFYQTFGADSSLPIPAIYFSEIDEATDHFLIVMQDLTDARMVEWFADGVEDVELALVSLAQIHAKFWDDKTLNDLQWLGRTDDIAQSDKYKSMLKQLLPAAKEKFSEVLTDYSWATLDAWLANWESVRLMTTQGSKTLIHREADMRQMFFPTKKLNRFVLFDWQSPEIGWGAADACRVIATSLSVTSRRHHEDSLIQLYTDKLLEHGVTNTSLESIWIQIRISLLMNVLAHLFSLLWVEPIETKVWQHSHLAVLGAAIEDWELLQLIEPST